MSCCSGERKVAAAMRAYEEELANTPPSQPTTSVGVAAVLALAALIWGIS